MRTSQGQLSKCQERVCSLKCHKWQIEKQNGLPWWIQRRRNDKGKKYSRWEQIWYRREEKVAQEVRNRHFTLYTKMLTWPGETLISTPETRIRFCWKQMDSKLTCSPWPVHWNMSCKWKDCCTEGIEKTLQNCNRMKQQSGAVLLSWRGRGQSQKYSPHVFCSLWSLDG